LRNTVRTAPTAPHRTRRAPRARARTRITAVRGRRAALLHARRARQRRNTRRAVVVCAFLAAVTPIAAGGVGSSPWGSWLGWDTWRDWATRSDAHPNDASSPSRAVTDARTPGAAHARTGKATSRPRRTDAPQATRTPEPTSTGVAASPTTLTSGAQCTAHVAPGGSDANAGSSTAPYATVSHAQSVAQPGDVVCVRGGVYHERVRLPRSGRGGAPITVGAYPGEAPVLDGTGIALKRTDALFEIAAGANYVTVQGLVIRNSSGRGLVNGGSYNRVLGATISNIANAGLLTTNHTAPAADNEYVGNDISFTVQSNNCHTSSDPCTATGGWESAINHYTAGGHRFGHDVYRANNVHDNGGEGMTVADGDIVVGNNLRDNFSVNIYVDGTRDAIIEKNFVSESEHAVPSGGESAYRLLAMGITLADETGPRNARNTIRNNLIVNTSIGLHFWEATSGSGLVGDVFDNNTVVNTWTCGICVDPGNHSNTVVRNNFVVPRRGIITSGLADDGITRAGNLFTRPDDIAGFVPGAGTFNLEQDAYQPSTAASPLLDKGVASSARDDIVGTPRPQGAGIDIGVYEART
jgi:Periplasmic copper-binding protein (NosD)